MSFHQFAGNLRSPAKIAAAFAIAALTCGTAFAQDMSVRIYNRSSTDLLSIETAAPGGYFHGDLLGDDLLESGYNQIIDFADQNPTGSCHLWVKVRGLDGRKWQFLMNVCTESGWTLRD